MAKWTVALEDDPNNNGVKKWIVKTQSQAGSDKGPTLTFDGCSDLLLIDRSGNNLKTVGGSVVREEIGEHQSLAFDGNCSCRLDGVEKAKINGEDMGSNEIGGFNEKLNNKASNEVNGAAFGLYKIEIDGCPVLVIERYPGTKLENHLGSSSSCEEKYKKTMDFFNKMLGDLNDTGWILSLYEEAAMSKFDEEKNRGSVSGMAESRSGDKTPMTDYLFFYARRKKIEKSIRYIIENPHRTLGEWEEVCRADSIPFYNTQIMLEIARAPQYLVEDKSGRYGFLSVNNKSYAVDRIKVSLHDETFDNPENRFILHIVSIFLNKISKVIDWLEGANDKDGKRTGNMKALQRSLYLLRNHPNFKLLKSGAIDPEQSKVLTKKPGYKELASIWRTYRGLIRDQNEAPTPDIITFRKWHMLYELWCYKLLCDKLGIKEPPTLKTETVTNKNGEKIVYLYLTAEDIEFKDGHVLLYNRNFGYLKDNQSYGINVFGEDNMFRDEEKDKEIDKNNYRPDFMILKNKDGDPTSYELLCVLDAKFSAYDFDDKFYKKNKQSEAAKDRDVLEGNVYTGDTEVGSKVGTVDKFCKQYMEATGVKYGRMIYLSDQKFLTRRFMDVETKDGSPVDVLKYLAIDCVGKFNKSNLNEYKINACRGAYGKDKRVDDLVFYEG